MIFRSNAKLKNLVITTFKNYQKLFIFSVSILGICIYLLSLEASFLFPSLKVNRTVLSSLIYSPDGSAEKYQIIKVKNNDKIMIEIYKILNEYNYLFVSRIDTETKYEGYFLLGGNATNLAYINVDDDTANEIIVPGFDNNLIAHLNVIKFDSNTKTFTLINQKFPTLGAKNLSR